ncbi:MAG: arylsulfatase [Porphyromonadaceae bacterium]|nr:arylsulfatase [Porphyromonadaceae bacterium]
MIKTNLAYQGVITLGMLGLPATTCTQTVKSKPNIIYILADDLGYGDVGCYGQKYIKTPNIDRLATEGLLFTQHYAGAPVSAPTRCCLMTGKHLGHAYIRNNREIKDSSDFKAGQTPLPENTFTIARMLQNAGYTTALIGKWGLGSIESNGAPNKQGFDFFYGYSDQAHAHNHYPLFLWRNEKQEFLQGNVSSAHPKIDKSEIVPEMEYKKYQGEHYSLDLMAGEALNFVEKNKDNPFFLYLAFTIPHRALQVPEESVESYENIFNETLYDGKRGYTPHPKPKAAYAGMITRMDQKIGELMDKLKVLGLDHNTIVMFSSDNGHTGTGGADVNFFNSSGGLRGAKGTLYEGGIKVPFIVRWTGKILPNKTTNHISAQYDLMLTLAELTGQKIEDTDGVSFLPTLLGNTDKQKKHDYLYWEFSNGGGQYAIRMGDLKGVRMNVKDNNESHWEIYNVTTDPSESKNIAENHPRLIQKFNQITKKRTPSVFPEWNFEK